MPESLEVRERSTGSPERTRARPEVRPGARARAAARLLRATGRGRHRGQSAGLLAWAALVTLCAGQLMIVLDATVVNVALPTLQRDLHFTSASLAWVVDGYLITFGGLLLLAGRLGDLVGRKRVLMLGLATFTGASVLCGLSADQAMLIGARFVQGIGAALTSAMVLGILVNLFEDPRRRATAMGVYAFVASAGGAIGLLAGGLLTQTLGWHAIFFINLPIGVAVMAAGMALVPGRAGIGLRHGVDWPGAVLVTTAPSLLVYAIVTGGSGGWLSIPTLGAGSAALVLAAAFVVLESRVPNPLIPLRLFSSRVRAGANLARTLYPVAMFATFYLGALYLQRVLHLTPLQTGLAFLPTSLCMALFSLVITSRVVARIGPRRTLAAGLLLDIAALSWLLRLPVHGGYAPDVLPSLILLGVGTGLAFLPSISLAMSGVEPGDTGVASGLTNVTFQLGAALGVALLAGTSSGRTAAVLAAGGSEPAALTAGYHLAFLVAIGALVLALVLAAALLPDRSPLPPAPGRAVIRVVRVLPLGVLQLGRAAGLSRPWAVPGGRGEDD